MRPSRASVVMILWLLIALAPLLADQAYRRLMLAEADSVIPASDVPMIVIPAGEFIMGLPIDEAWQLNNQWRSLPESARRPDAFSREIPQLTVYLNTFLIDQVEVTNAHYRRCVKSGLCRPITIQVDYLAQDYANNPLYDDYPVRGVTWQDANTYCRWLGKRLPSEAEWEKAARGSDGRLYPWGNDWQAEAAHQPQHAPAVVGSYPADSSPFGLLDMAGNAPEWVAGAFSPYPNSPRTAYYTPLTAKRLGIIRGLGMGQVLSILAVRTVVYPDDTVHAPGFRCAQGPSPLPLAQAIRDASFVPDIEPLEQVDLSRMAFIPAGEFLMGSNETRLIGGRNDAAPAHFVYLDDYYIDKYEVTIAQFVEFLNALSGHVWRCGGYNCVWQRSNGDFAQQGILLAEGRYQVKPGFEDLPVTYIRWEAADAYCHWAGKRLPTEAEWEKAARGADGRAYPWGNDWQPGRAAGSIGLTGGHYPLPVGSHPGDVSPYGLYDMLGNADEWVQDWYSPSYYYFSPAENPTGPEERQFRVYRGISGPSAERGITVRRGGRGPFIGFRCAYDGRI